MNVKDLKPKQGNVEITVDVIDVGPAREFQKFGKPGRVATALAKDKTGDIKLSLWNEDIDKVKAGDTIKISNGYVNEWQGELQLTTGRLGKMAIVGKVEPSKDVKDDTQVMTNIPPKSDEEDINVEEEDISDDGEDEI